MADKLYKILPKDRSEHTLSYVPWLRQAKPLLMCPECDVLRRKKIFPNAIDVRLLSIPKRLTCSFVSELGVGIIKKDFAEVVSSDLDGFVLGKCFNKDGQEINEYLTCYSRDYLLIRGSPGSSWATCGTCGRIRYYEKGNPWVLRSSLGKRRLFHNQYCAWYLAADLADRIPWDRFRDRMLYPIPIQDAEIDGFHLEAAGAS